MVPLKILLSKYLIRKMFTIHYMKKNGGNNINLFKNRYLNMHRKKDQKNI